MIDQRSHADAPEPLSVHVPSSGTELAMSLARPHNFAIGLVTLPHHLTVGFVAVTDRVSIRTIWATHRLSVGPIVPTNRVPIFTICATHCGLFIGHKTP